jgi:hypothetical protein
MRFALCQSSEPRGKTEIQKGLLRKIPTEGNLSPKGICVKDAAQRGTQKGKSLSMISSARPVSGLMVDLSIAKGTDDSTFVATSESATRWTPNV